jgi:creatinine amidohydrolase
MTWEEVAELNGRNTVAILPVGAVEAHGPHLPFGTDVIIARGMAEAGAAKLLEDGSEVLVLPPVAYTPARFAEDFPGTIGVRPGTLTVLLLDIAEALARHGMSILALANCHLDPAHLDAIHAAVQEIVSRGLLSVAFPDLTRKPWAVRLGEEFRSGACHAGRYEGSLMMALAPELVREHIASALPPNPASLSTAIREGLASFEDAGGPRAYFGWPAEATREEGERTVDTLGGILADAVRAELERVAKRGESES